MEKELDFLIEYFEESIGELQKELELDPDSEFIKGKIKGLNQALRTARMYNKHELPSFINVIID